MSGGKWVLGIAGVAALVVLAALPAASFSTGVVGFSGNPATNSGLYCTACHSGGLVPIVRLQGPTSVAPGTVNTYTLIISGGQQVAAGLDVSVTGGSLTATEADTQVITPENELTHLSPRNVDGTGTVSYSFDWTAPAAPAFVTMYAAGNSVNLAQGNNGDNANTDTLQILVAASTATPGESSGSGLDPLLVTGYDPITGDIDLSYGAACETTDHNIYYGPLDEVSTLAWSGDTCSVGASGTVTGFNPGGGSYFFVIVGANGGDEGSYGLSRDAGGTTSERPPFLTSVCGETQTLTDRCD